MLTQPHASVLCSYEHGGSNKAGNNQANEESREAERKQTVQDSSGNDTARVLPRVFTRLCSNSLMVRPVCGVMPEK